MSHKDTLTLYEEQIAKGVPDEQAKVIAHQLGALGDSFSFALNNISRDMFWMRVIGSAMTVAFFSNIVAIVWIK